MGFFPAAMLAELQRPSAEVYKRLTVHFPAERTTLILAPDATELLDTNHSAQGAASAHLALDDPETSPDEDTSYLRHDTNDTMGESRVSFPALPTTVTDVHRVWLYVRARTNSTADAAEDDGPWTFALHVNGTNYYGQAESRRFYNASYRTEAIWFDTNPDTDAAWTVAEVDALQASLIGLPESFGDAFGIRWTQVYLAVEVSTARVGRYSNVTINSRADGPFDALVLSWGAVEYAVSPATGAIQRPKVQVLLADQSEELSQIFSAGGIDVRRSVATIEYISPNVPRASWATVFTGVLTAWREVDLHQWSLEFSTDDTSLSGKFPKSKYSERDFENANPDAYDFFMHVVLGRHDSEGIADVGMIQCPNVDRVNFRRYVTQGIAKRITRVYSSGNLEEEPVLRVEGVTPGTALTAHYQVIYPIINGRQVTLLEFNLTGASQAEQDLFNRLIISADVDGLDELGDGTGELMTNPADLLRWVFVNLVKNDWRSGDYFSQTTDAPIDNDLFDETRNFFNLIGQASSRLLGGTKTAEEARMEFNRWAEDLHVPLFWTEEGKLACRPNTPFTLDFYIDHPWIIEGLVDLDRPEYDSDDSNLFDRMVVSYLHQHRGDQFLSSIEIRDSAIGEEKTQTFDAKWLPSSLTPGGEVSQTPSATPAQLRITGRTPTIVGPS